MNAASRTKRVAEGETARAPFDSPAAMVPNSARCALRSFTLNKTVAELAPHALRQIQRRERRRGGACVDVDA